MKIFDILTEDVGAAVAYKNLSPLQIGLLKKIAAGRFDVQVASPQAQDAFDQLASYRLVDDLSGELTPKGQAALALAQKYGTFKSTAGTRPAQPQDDQAPDDGSFEDDLDAIDIS